MKRYNLPFIFVGIAALFFFSCQGDDDGDPQQTPRERAIAVLAGNDEITWTVAGGGSVSRDGTSQTANFADFEITFRNRGSAGLNYQTTGGTGLFDASGNWTLEGEDYELLRLTGIQPAANKNIQYSNQGGDLRLEFTVTNPTAENARTQALLGFYVFTLKRKP